MPSFQGNPLANFYKRIMQINQTSNTGVDATTRNIQTGDGTNTALSLSDDQVMVKPQTDNTTSALSVANQGGSNILEVDTANSLVKAGASLVNVNTMHKSMGLYEFSPAGTGYHNPLIANRVGMQGAEALTSDTDWGTSTDPPTTLDVSGLADPENAIAVYWNIHHNITIDSVYYHIVADGSVTCNMHIMSYTLDNDTNYGDLSAGAVCASGSVSAISTGTKQGTLSLNSANVDNGKVLIGFCENSTNANDFSIILDIYYHIR